MSKEPTQEEKRLAFEAELAKQVTEAPPTAAECRRIIREEEQR